jgi:hypothetical protein
VLQQLEDSAALCACFLHEGRVSQRITPATT